MTLVSSILLDAYRESNLIAATATALSSTQETEALRRFTSLLASVIGWEAGENLKQWPVGVTGYAEPPDCLRADVWRYPPVNSMLVLNLSGADTIYLPVNPSDGARIAVQDLGGNLATYNVTLDGNGRLVEGARTLPLADNSLNRTWFYRADLGDWKRVTTLAVTDEMPFPVEFDDMFIILLAMRLNPRFGRKMDAQTVTYLKRMQAMFTARYAQAEDLRIKGDIAPSHMSTQGFGGFPDADDAVLYGG